MQLHFFFVDPCICSECIPDTLDDSGGEGWPLPAKYRDLAGEPVRAPLGQLVLDLLGPEPKRLGWLARTAASEFPAGLIRRLASVEHIDVGDIVKPPPKRHALIVRHVAPRLGFDPGALERLLVLPKGATPVERIPSARWNWA